MTKRPLLQVEAADMEFLRKFHGVALRDEVLSCEIDKAVNVESLHL